jgi:hypothetical protein
VNVPVVRGVIDRRILANFRVAPELFERTLPPPFRPRLVGGWGMAGICLIRLKQLRPRWVPACFDVSSENAAHRIAVEWKEGAEQHEGVFIPRRDTSSRINAWLGGRLFPGVHHRSHFQVDECDGHFRIEMRHRGDGMHLLLQARLANDLPAGSVFGSLQEASEFFRRGALGYSVSNRVGTFDGLELRCVQWRMEPLTVEHVASSFFANEEVFPRGTAEFDCALLMRNIPHEWHAKPPLCCEEEICASMVAS